MIFEQSVVPNSFVPPELEPEYARFLRKTAHLAVAAVRLESEPAPVPVGP